MSFGGDVAMFFGVHPDQDWFDTIERLFMLALPIGGVLGAGYLASQGAMALTGGVLNLIMSVASMFFNPAKLMSGAVDVFNKVDTEKLKEAAEVASALNLDDLAGAVAKFV